MKLVAVPIKIGSVRVHVAKGRRWSIVEHALLEAICKKPKSAQKLSIEANLPLRMVIEALINLMRAGWVELRAEGKDGEFFPTEGGRSHMGRDDLPAVTKMFKKNVRYVIEQVTGSILKYRDLNYAWESRIGSYRPDAILQANPSLPAPNPTKVIGSLLQEDEEYLGLASGAARPGDAFAFAQVSGDVIRGIPGASQGLIEAVLSVASRRDSRPVRLKAIESPRTSVDAESIPLSFNPDQNLILDGPAHKAALLDIIKRASARIVIHSTFIGTGACDEIIVQLMNAARRGVQVDVLWGKSDAVSGENTTREAVSAISVALRSARLEQFMRAHPFSTSSHSKIIVADDGRNGWVAVLGSCNWLSTDFTSFEASILLRDQRFVAEVLSVMAQMAMSATGWNGGISSALAGQAVNIRRFTPPSTGRRASARIVLAGEHSECILSARDTATSSIIVGSHRLGRSAQNLTITPTVAAIQNRPLNASLYYGKLSTGVTEEYATSLRMGSSGTGLKVQQVHYPRMHAKFLAWDDDDLLITSHNLLSADPSADYQEVGIHIKGTGVARHFREKVRVILGT